MDNDFDAIPAFFLRVYKKAALAVALLILAILSYYTVGQYEGAVLTRFGRLVDVTAPGLNWKIPFIDEAHKFRIDIQSLQVSVTNEKGQAVGINTYTVDNQEVDIVSTVFYRIPRDRISFVYQNAQDFRARLFSMTVDRIKAEVGKINTAHIAERRGELRDHIHEVLKHDALVLGLDVTDFQLTNIEYTRSFRAAVEAAASAKAMVETREQEKQQAIRTAEKAKIEATGLANAVREKAKGDADARLLAATAEAKAIQLQGEATAEAIRAQANALQQNAKLVELRKAERWDGKLPVQVLSSVLPMMEFKAAGSQ